MELFVALLDGAIFYGIIYSLFASALELLKQHYLRDLCKYKGTGEKSGRACVICAYHHHCNRARQNTTYKAYAYYRRVLPHKAKEMFDEIWAEEKAKE